MYETRVPVFAHDMKTSKSDERRGELKTSISLQSFQSMIKQVERVFYMTS